LIVVVKQYHGASHEFPRLLKLQAIRDLCVGLVRSITVCSHQKEILGDNVLRLHSSFLR
jgi:hypothetical protein